MAVLIGAVAYRALPSNKINQQVLFWRKKVDDEDSAISKEVLCPRCGEPYILLEEFGVANELLHEDMCFLAKALSSGHPHHPTSMVIRDPDCSLLQLFQAKAPLKGD